MNTNTPILRIVCSAIRYKDGLQLVGPRHFDKTMVEQLIRAKGPMAKANPDDLGEQGFLDQFGDFHDRKQALAIAKRCSQLNDEPIRGDELYSENLY